MPLAKSRLHVGPPSNRPHDHRRQDRRAREHDHRRVGRRVPAPLRQEASLPQRAVACETRRRSARPTCRHHRRTPRPPCPHRSLWPTARLAADQWPTGSKPTPRRSQESSRPGRYGLRAGPTMPSPSRSRRPPGQRASARPSASRSDPGAGRARGRTEERWPSAVAQCHRPQAAFRRHQRFVTAATRFGPGVFIYCTVTCTALEKVHWNGLVGQSTASVCRTICKPDGSTGGSASTSRPWRLAHGPAGGGET